MVAYEVGGNVAFPQVNFKANCKGIIRSMTFNRYPDAITAFFVLRENGVRICSLGSRRSNVSTIFADMLVKWAPESDTAWTSMAPRAL